MFGDVRTTDVFPPGWKPRLYGRQNACRYRAAGTEAKAQRSITERGGRKAGWMANDF